MKLKDAIRYLELTKCDFISDLNEYAKLMRDASNGYFPDDFTERMEGFSNKLLLVWVDGKGGVKQALEDEVKLPSHAELVAFYCSSVFESEEDEEESQTSFFSSSLLKRKVDKIKENKTIQLLTFFGNNEINMSQYLDIELDVIYKVIELIIQKKEEEKKKQKQKKRGL